MERKEQLSKAYKEEDVITYRNLISDYRILLANLVRCKKVLQHLSCEKDMCVSIDELIIDVVSKLQCAISLYFKKIINVKTS